MQIVVEPGGMIRCIYSEELDLHQLGQLRISRGSYVEPNAQGQWIADLVPLGGPQLGPFLQRSDALQAERRWLKANWLIPRLSE